MLAILAGTLVAAAVRLPALGSASLASPEQVTLAESQGLSTRAPLPAGEAVLGKSLPRRSGALEIARGATMPPLYGAGLALWTRAAGTSETALRLPSAVAGVLAVLLVAALAGRIASPWAPAWAASLVALSPIHALASRSAEPEAPLVLALLLALWLAARVESSGSRAPAVALGLAIGLLATSGVAALAAVALVPLGWLAARADRRRAAALATATAAAFVVAAALLGVARSPLDFGDIPSWVPDTTVSGIARCTGASFTRVAGLEYHLAVSHARYVIPLTALFVGLMVLGASRLPARPRSLLVAGAALPFALGAALALGMGRVMPLQATRLLAALPFLALLMAAGLASLRGWSARVAGLVVAGTTAAFLGLALGRPSYETSPTQAIARDVARCRGTVVAVQRPLDLLALAAWGVPGPFVLRSPGAPPPDGPALVVGPSATCASGGASCAPFPDCGG